MMENKFTIKETLLLFAGVGFIIIWVGEVIQGHEFRSSYFWGMFALACFFGFQYTKNERLQKAKNEAKTKELNKKKKN